ncbi:hypothetical protein M2146_002495 [Lachnospiraceae bacterium PF1-22]
MGVGYSFIISWLYRGPITDLYNRYVVAGTLSEKYFKSYCRSIEIIEDYQYLEKDCAIDLTYRDAEEVKRRLEKEAKAIKKIEGVDKMNPRQKQALLDFASKISEIFFEIISWVVNISYLVFLIDYIRKNGINNMSIFLLSLVGVYMMLSATRYCYQEYQIAGYLDEVEYRNYKQLSIDKNYKRRDREKKRILRAVKELKKNN